MVCFSLSREEEVGPPAHRHAAPAADGPRNACDFGATVAARRRDPGRQRLPDDALAAAWQRERAALRLLGFEPSQATVVVRADPDVPTDKVQRLIETGAGGRLHAVRAPRRARSKP